MARLWADLPIGRVTRLAGAGPDALELTLTPLPDGAPAVVTYRPRCLPSRAAVVDEVLGEMETAALDLFPAWLADAYGIEGRGGAGVAAVRALAMHLAPSTGHFGPFLADLAERALRGARPSTGRFAPEVRAAGLALVIATSFGRPDAGLLVRVPEGLTADDEYSLVGACEWLADRGGLGVWLTGEPLAVVDWLNTIRVCVPDEVARLEGEVRRSIPDPLLPTAWYPPVAGMTHPGSRAERALESALSHHPWARGRAWNQTYQSHPLSNPIRLDLAWERERCVVEIDGPEHRAALRFAADRQRDVQLHLDGYTVLRFTNTEVLEDVEVVVSQIERLLQSRRLITSGLNTPEGQRYA